MPGMILINSAASRPTIDNSSTMFLFSVWLDWPVSVETTSALVLTSTTSVVLWTWRIRAGKDRVAPWVTTTPFCSTVWRPGALTVTVYEPGGTDGK